MSDDVRDDLIAAISARGFYGRKRDWSLGKTIVCARKVTVDIDGLPLLVDVLTLVPLSHDTWCLHYDGLKSNDEVRTAELVSRLQHLFAEDGALFKSKAQEALQRIGKKKRFT